MFIVCIAHMIDGLQEMTTSTIVDNYHLKPLDDWVIVFKILFYFLMLFMISTIFLYETGPIKRMFSQHCRYWLAWCFSTRASVATVLTMYPCASRCLRVNGLWVYSISHYDIPLNKTLFIVLKLLHIASHNFINTGTNNGLLPDSTKPLPELLITNQYGPVTFT